MSSCSNVFKMHLRYDDLELRLVMLTFIFENDLPKLKCKFKSEDLQNLS